jgi:sortase A
MLGLVRRSPLLEVLELGCWALGLLLVSLAVASSVATHLGHEEALKGFAQARAAEASRPSSEATRGLGHSEPDQSLWATERIRRYEESGWGFIGRPEAVLRIPRLGLEVPVFAGATEEHMTRGAGRIAGSPPFGEPGNVGVSSHRDGYFRGLKDIRVGDEIVVDTLTHRYRYVVEEIRVTDPENTTVLWPGTVPEVTLVTCYPFYYFGNAPQRFVVRAELREESR